MGNKRAVVFTLFCATFILSHSAAQVGARDCGLNGSEGDCFISLTQWLADHPDYSLHQAQQNFFAPEPLLVYDYDWIPAESDVDGANALVRMTWPSKASTPWLQLFGDMNTSRKRVLSVSVVAGTSCTVVPSSTGDLLPQSFTLSCIAPTQDEVAGGR